MERRKAIEKKDYECKGEGGGNEMRTNRGNGKIYREKFSTPGISCIRGL